VTLRREGALARTGQAQGRGASDSGPHCHKRPGLGAQRYPWSLEHTFASALKDGGLR
jgi:hypothetical protein